MDPYQKFNRRTTSSKKGLQQMLFNSSSPVLTRKNFNSSSPVLTRKSSIFFSKKSDKRGPIAPARARGFSTLHMKAARGDVIYIMLSFGLTWAWSHILWSKHERPVSVLIKTHTLFHVVDEVWLSTSRMTATQSRFLTKTTFSNCAGASQPRCYCG